MRGSDFIFDSVQLLNYKYHKISFKRGDSYIHSPDWVKKKQQKIQKMKTINVFSMWQLMHQIMKKIKETRKEYQK